MAEINAPLSYDTEVYDSGHDADCDICRVARGKQLLPRVWVVMSGGFRGVFTEREKADHYARILRERSGAAGVAEVRLDRPDQPTVWEWVTPWPRSR